MKGKCKIVLDVIMLIMMLTLFDKQFISMAYHEIAGLILLALIIVHIALNIKTAAAMCKKFLRVPPAIKVGLVVDILLLVCFVLLGVSGVLISHTVLTGISSDNVIFKQLHMFAGGLSVILLGVHIGLHICRKPMPAAAAIVLSVVVLCGGVYGVVNSSEVRWLTMPVSMVGGDGAAKPPVHEENTDNMRGGAPADKSGEGMHGGAEIGENRHGGTLPDGEITHQSGNAMGKNRQPLSLIEKVQNVVMFLGMILSCTMITYWIAVKKHTKNAD